MEATDPVVIAAQVVNYLTGEDLNVLPEQTEEGARAIIAALRPEIPDIAGNLMRQDRGLREIIVQTLRMRLILSLHYRAQEAAASGLKKRVTDILLSHGHEFPEEPSPRRYHALVSNLITWAESSRFPGREGLE